MSKTILCVDDSATMQTVCEITFRVSGYEYVGARSADEAMNKAKAQTPALILADATMPDKSGYDLCRELKSDPSLAAVPVILVCGNSAPYDAAKGASAGADGHLTKPWDTTKLLEQIGEIEKQIADKGVGKPGSAGASSSGGSSPASKPAPAKAAPSPAPAAKAAPPSRPAPASPKATTLGLSGPGPVAAPKPAPRMPKRAPTPVPTAGGAGQPGSFPGPQNARTAAPASSRPAPSEAPAAGASLPTPPAGMDRPPMIKGVPTKRPGSLVGAGARAGTRPPAPRSATLMGMPNVQLPPAQGGKAPGVTPIPATHGPGPSFGPSAGGSSSSIEQAAAQAAAAVPAAAQRAAASAGLDPSGPEVAALVKMSREVIEQVVWEVVPQLAETIIKENLDRLAASK